MLLYMQIRTKKRGKIMKIKVIQEFRGKIGTVEYNNSEIDKYYATAEILTEADGLIAMLQKVSEDIQEQFLSLLPYSFSHFQRLSAGTISARPISAICSVKKACVRIRFLLSPLSSWAAC